MRPTYPLLYLGYGANTNRSHMARRCPTARYLGNAELLDYRLIFRSVADVIPVKGQRVVCAMWSLQPADERALDAFEGYPNFYGKAFATIPYRGEDRPALFYYMAGHRKDRHEPPQAYEHTLRAGYVECNMDTAQIDAAIADSVKSERRALRYSGKWLDEKDQRRVRDERVRDLRDSIKSAKSVPSYSGLEPARPHRTLADELDDVSADNPDWPDWFVREYMNGQLRGA